MRRIYLFHLLALFASVFACSAVLAAGPNSLFTDGNAAYSVGDYDKAIAAFEQITEERGFAPSVLYNLANSYAQKGMVGRAVLNYERALKLAPSNADIIGNLAKIRKEAGLFTPEMTRVEQFFSIVSIDGWALLVLFAVASVAVLLGCRLKLNPSGKMFGWATGLSLMVLLLGIAGISYNYRAYNPLIVVEKEVKLQVSPFDGATPVGAIAEGKALQGLGKDYGEYTYVEDDSGRKGWLHRGAAEPVCN